MDRESLDLKSFAIGWAIILLLWCFCSYVLDVPEYLLASPFGVIEYASGNVDVLLGAVLLTGSQALVGWVLALVGGILIGALIHHLAWMRKAALPVIIATQTTPIIALAPLITLWFGYGWTAKTVIALVVAIFPIILATYSGLADTKPTHIYIYKLAGSGATKIFFKVKLNSAWPALIPAVKTSVVLAVIGSVVAEFMGGNRGLGFLIMQATYGTKSRILMSAIILSAILGQLFLLVLEYATRPLEKRFRQT